MEIYKTWLNENNVKFEEKDFGLSFKYQGGYFIVGRHDNDWQYFNIVMPGIFDFADNPDVPREVVLEALNKINADFKVCKAVCDDEDCWLTTEILIDDTPDLDSYFDRLLNILHQARLEFFQHIKNSKN